ncbi:MAG: metallophosphoesterase [Clostridia bacterium]|nr:metallophosphoesterase [Clostridia bacterium]
MKVFAIGDLHLSHQVEKPMDVFGGHWLGHADKIEENWNAAVGEGDTVIIPGDFSWATYLGQAEEDFLFLDRLPGKKILLKGNHDYWWETVTKMKKFLDSIGASTIGFLYNNAVMAGGRFFCGTKGWDPEEEKDPVIINRETLRFRASLSGAEAGGDITAVFHYPPMNIPGLVSIMNEHGVVKCIYGHVHGTPQPLQWYEKDGIEYLNVAADRTDFCPVEI